MGTRALPCVATFLAFLQQNWPAFALSSHFCSKAALRCRFPRISAAKLACVATCSVALCDGVTLVYIYIYGEAETNSRGRPPPRGRTPMLNSFRPWPRYEICWYSVSAWADAGSTICLSWVFLTLPALATGEFPYSSALSGRRSFRLPCAPIRGRPGVAASPWFGH